MIFTSTGLDGSYSIQLQPKVDERGWFARYYCKNEFAKIGHTAEWVQMNHSYTAQRGTIRGMHFQIAPYREIKMLRCISGSVYDVIVDLRRDSPTFLQWRGFELSAINKVMLYIPEGFAHGFQTLEDDSELIYHHSEFYQPGFENGLRYNDPALKINWPMDATIVSERDAQHPFVDTFFKGI